MTFKLSLKIKRNSLINKQIQEVFFMESNSSNFIYTVTPQFWFGRLLSHSFHSRFEKSILLYRLPLVRHCCLMDSFWLHPLINSTHIFYNWMEPPFQKTRKSLILIPTFISIHLHQSHNKNLLLFSLYSQSHKESYALQNEDNPHFTQHSSFDYPFHVPFLQSPYGTFRVVGTYNGLLCLFDDLHTESDMLYLWNPYVTKLVNLPSPNVFPYTRFCTIIGFGFDPKTNDYKVVRVVLNLRSRFIHCPLVNGERLGLVWLSYVLYVVVSHMHLSMELCIVLLAEYMMTDFNVLF